MLDIKCPVRLRPPLENLQMRAVLPTLLAALVFVSGYHNRYGTWVRPHYRTAPNNVTYDNWSAAGNVNPITGKRGYRMK